jgi:hypothetical protein
MTITAKQNQSLFDLALLLSGDAMAAFDLALENGLSLTGALQAGTAIVQSAAQLNVAVVGYLNAGQMQPATGIEASQLSVAPTLVWLPISGGNQSGNVSKINAFATQQNQSLFDVALQLSGDAMAAFDLALENGLSLTGALEAGTAIVQPAAPMSVSVVGYLQAARVQPATGIEVVPAYLNVAPTIVWVPMPGDAQSVDVSSNVAWQVG